MTKQQKLDVVGLRDIAKLLQVDGRTPTTWRGRGILPPEDGFISETFPIWHRSTVLKWAQKTGRLPGSAAHAARQPVRETVDSAA